MFKSTNLTVHFTQSAELNWRWYFSSVHVVSKKDLQMQKIWLGIINMVLAKFSLKKN